MTYKKVLGLEVHAQINTKTKLFSRALNQEAKQPNINVTWLDAGMPGSLPVPNQEAVNMALKTALALGMHINKESIFDRKQYFYPDLPLGYQISQFYKPIGLNGVLHCSFGPIRINRLHIEADAGKTINEDGSIFIDLNRVGVPLMEIVTEPDFKSAQEVVEYIKELRALLLCLGTCKCDMEAGNLRVDVNLSLHKEGEPYGTRVEMKNINSYRFIAKAIDYEADVQEHKLNAGELVVQETKLFDSKSGVTKSMRDKEDASDYRYFPDPDLLPIVLEEEFIEQVRNNLPELPQVTRVKYQDMGVALEQATVLTEHPIRVKFFNKLLGEIDVKFAGTASNWIVSELNGRLAKMKIDLEDFASQVMETKFISSFSNVIVQCQEGKISRSNAKDLLDDLMCNYECDLDSLIKERGYMERLGEDDIKNIIAAILKNSPDEVAKYKAGKTALLMFFVGNVMKETKGRCDPEFVKIECLRMIEQV